MAFLKNSELLNFSIENDEGVYNSDVETEQPNVRFREVDLSVEVESEDDSRYLTGDWGQTDENLTGARMGTVNYSLKVAPGEFTEETDPGVSEDAEHSLNYKELFPSMGLKLVEKNTSNVDNEEGSYVIFPSKENASRTISIARFLTESSATGLTGRIEALKGGMGSFSLSVDGRGAPFMISSEIQGAVEKIEDVDENNIPVFDDSTANRTLGDKFLNTTITIEDLTTGGDPIDFCVSSLTLDANTDVTEIACQRGAGINNYIITSIAPTLDIDPLLQTIDDFDYWDGMNEEHTYRVTVESEHIKILIPRAQLNSSDISETDGYMRNALNFRAMRNIDGDIPDVLDAGDIDNPQEALFFIQIGETERDF